MIGTVLGRQLSDHPRTCVFLASLVCSLVVFLALPGSTISTTATDFEAQVLNLLAGRGFMDAEGTLLDRTPPIFPLALAAIRIMAGALGIREVILLFVFTAGCLAAASVFVYNLAALVIGPGRAWMAALLFAIHPHILFSLTMPLSETPFLPVLYCSVWLFLSVLLGAARREGWLMFLAGVLGGVAMLIRPAGLFVPALLAGVVIVLGRMGWSRRVQYAALLLAGVVVTALPWEFYVWRHSGKIVMVSSNGVSTLRDGFAFYKVRRNPIWIPPRAERVVQRAWGSYEELTDVKSVVRLLADEAVHNPLGVVELYSYKAVRSWYGVDTQHPLKELANMLTAVLYMIPAVFGLRKYFRRDAYVDPRAGAVLVLLILYFWAMATVSVSIARYMVPTIAFTCVFVSLCVPVRRLAVSRTASGSVPQWGLVG